MKIQGMTGSRTKMQHLKRMLFLSLCNLFEILRLLSFDFSRYKGPGLDV